MKQQCTGARMKRDEERGEEDKDFANALRSLRS